MKASFRSLFPLSGVLTLSLAVFVVAGSFVTGSGMAWAQQQGQGGRRPGGFGGGPGGPGGGLDVFGLIGSEQVQKEIELIDAQKGDVQKLSDERREAMRGMFGNIRELPEAERQQKMAEMREKMEANRTEYTKKLADLLLPHQFERLQQISIQVRGASALSDPEVAGKLNLSDAQKSQLTELQEANRGEMQKLFEGARGDEAARQGMREKIELFRTQANEKAMAILTSEQRAQFEAMKGEKFELDMSQFQRGGPGGRPQRRPETGTDNN